MYSYPAGPQTRPRNFTAILLVPRLFLETEQLSLWYPDSSCRLYICPADPKTLPRDCTAILIVFRLFLDTSQLTCWSPDSSMRLQSYPAGIQTLPIYFSHPANPQTLPQRWHSHPAGIWTLPRDFTAILLYPSLVLETSQLSCWFPDSS